jgi:hypothetical protein
MLFLIHIWEDEKTFSQSIHCTRTRFRSQLEILETRNGKSPTDPLTGDLIQAAQRGSWVIRQEVPYDNGSPRVLITLFDAFEQAFNIPTNSSLF